MAYSIAQLKDDLIGIGHGTNLNKIQNLNGLFNRTAKKVLAEIDPSETIRIANLTNAIHDDIYDYTLPSDVKGTKVIDIRPQVNRTIADNVSQFTSEEFDLRKSTMDDIIQTKYRDGTKSIRISKNISPAPVTLHSMDSLTGNGTVAVVGSATGLATNSQYYVSGNKSIEFNIVSTGDGIQITGMSSVNLTDHDEVSEHFVRFYMDDVSNLTSATLIWGNDLTSNYWTGTAQTAQADGTAFRNGWNTIKVKWSDATESGTVDPTAIDSLKITFASGAINNVRVDLWTSSIGEIYEIEYYSKFLFSNSSGTFQETTSADDDTINLDTDSYNIFLYECAYLMAQQMQGEDSGFDVRFFRDELYGDGSANKKGLYKLYKKSNPSRAIKIKSTYYRIH